MEESDAFGEDVLSMQEIECMHESHEAVWLPLLKGDHQLTLAPHPYCHKCGIVRNIGPDRAKKLGYYVEVLSEIDRYLKHEHSKGGKHKLTEAQKRLVVKEMCEEELFVDLYGVLASAQEEKFIDILQEYVPQLERNEIEYHLE